MLGVLHRAGDTLEVLHGAYTGVEIQFLAQGHVQGADTTTNGSGQWAFDGHQVFLDGVQGGLGQPFAGIVHGFLTGQYFFPDDLLFAIVGFFHGGVEHAAGGGPDVRSDTVTFDEWENRVVRNVQLTVADGDLGSAHGEYLYWLVN